MYVNNNNLFLNSFNLDKTELNLVAAGTSQIVKLSATYSWDVIDKPNWLTISPFYGIVEIKHYIISAAPTTESRSGVLILTTMGKNRKNDNIKHKSNSIIWQQKK